MIYRRSHFALNLRFTFSYQRTKAGSARAILIAATIVAAIVAAGSKPRTRATVASRQQLSQLARGRARATVASLKHWLLRHGLRGCSIGVCFVASNEKRKERKKFWVHPITSQRLLKGKFYSLYEDLRAHPQKIFRYFRMSTAPFDKLLVLLGTSLTFQDTRMRNSVPPEERLSVTLW
jgi:hypothetical protein